MSHGLHRTPERFESAVPRAFRVDPARPPAIQAFDLSYAVRDHFVGHLEAGPFAAVVSYRSLDWRHFSCVPPTDPSSVRNQIAVHFTGNPPGQPASCQISYVDGPVPVE